MKSKIAILKVKFRKEHKKLGLCSECGKKVFKNTTYCKTHLMKHRERDKKYYKLRRKK